MVRNLIIPFTWLLLLLALSCKKKIDYNNSLEPNPAPVNCPLCPFADSLSGTYKGFYTNFSNVTDSMEIDLEHIFMNVGFGQDSTNMFFKLTKRYNNGNESQTFVSMDNSAGVFYANSLGDSLYIEEDSMHIVDVYLTVPPSVGFRFNGKKMP